MKLGFNEATSKGCSTLATDLDLCEKVGFDYIEIRLDMLRTYLKEHTVEDLSDFFQHNRLKPHAMNALYVYEELFSSQDNPDKHQEVMDDFLLGCETARCIGSKYFIVVVPLHRNPQVEGPYTTSRGKVQVNCVRVLKKLGEMAASYDVNLCLELVGHKYSAVRTVEAAWDIVKAVNRNNVGLCFDACNMFLYHRLQDFSVMELVEPGKIFDVHINDADDSPMQGLVQTNRKFCGTGEIDLMNFLRVLKKVGYQGNVAIETFRPEYWAKSPEWVISNAYSTTVDTLRRANIQV